MSSQKALRSPRIVALEEALIAGDNTALDTFWQEIEAHGAPLMEELEEGYYLVTFLWHARQETHNVVIWGGPAGLEYPADNRMARLLETDLWYRTYRVQADLRGVYTLSTNDSVDAEIDNHEIGTRFIPDPLNPRQFVAHKDEEIPNDKEVIFSILELPAAPVQSWIVPRPEVPTGQLNLHRLSSRILNNQRRVWVYTPDGYVESGEPYRLLVLFDGWSYIDLIPTPTILDNLTYAGKIPPMVAVLIDSPDQATRNRELTCHPPLIDFLRQELMPWLHEHYHVTNDPARTIVGGNSYGGLAAAFVGLHAPEFFGNVLSQSGSFWWDKEPDEDIQQEWLIQQFIASPTLSLHFYLEVGLKEDSGWIYMVGCNRHFRDVLRLKGYQVHYYEFNGYHHPVSNRGTLADGLLALLGD
ncbi:hypothetical protein KDA_72880 [Dictyobacter alpinus]|uniref:Enterochelin esterase N-terminal domain-containing protein n=1 Tax=Dictyobacter alpinus TaxID=2014873 RepID=A0A402BKC6_9CHLR|nr:enterochelin esterase [Dictyobacter alpinus]GCE31804.1 hypothetical protein KDA_72880 [Dictyobacter alpinus]